MTGTGRNNVSLNIGEASGVLTPGTFAAEKRYHTMSPWEVNRQRQSDDGRMPAEHKPVASENLPQASIKEVDAISSLLTEGEGGRGQRRFKKGKGTLGQARETGSGDGRPQYDHEKGTEWLR